MEYQTLARKARRARVLALHSLQQTPRTSRKARGIAIFYSTRKKELHRAAAKLQKQLSPINLEAYLIAPAAKAA